MWSWASGWAGDPEAYRGMPGQWAGEASNAGTRAEGRGIIEGPWDRKKLWQIEFQAPRGSTAANRNTRVRLRSSWSQSSALEHGIGRMHLPRVHYTQAPYLGRGGRELALALPLSVTSLCLGLRLRCWRQAHGGWRGAAQGGLGGGWGWRWANPRRPKLSAQEWEPMAYDP